VARAKRKAATAAAKPPRLLYEHHSEPLLPRKAFVRRVLAHGGLALIMLSVSLVIGVLGYRGFEGMGWVDAFLNASMILGGMGPVAELHSDGAKVFAAGYALFSGVVFLAMAGVLFAPVMHRLLHRMHMDK
jgi:hypothetical protein